MDNKIFSLKKILNNNINSNIEPLIINGIDYRLNSYNNLKNVSYIYDKDLDNIIDEYNLKLKLNYTKENIVSKKFIKYISSKSFISDIFYISKKLDNFNLYIDKLLDKNLMFSDITNFLLSYSNQTLVYYIQDLDSLNIYNEKNSEIIFILIEKNEKKNCKINLNLKNINNINSLNIFLGQNSNLDIDIKIYNCNIIFDLNIFLDINSKLDSNIYYIESNFINFYNFILNGNNTSLKVKNNIKLSFNLGSIFTKQKHIFSNSISDFSNKSISSNNSKILYKGFVDITQKASNCTASQSNKMLILDNTVSYISVPSLNVLNKNVKCFHSSVSSYINNDHIKYLNSKGIDKKSSIKILSDAFINI